jgi:hypothetical protein
VLVNAAVAVVLVSVIVSVPVAEPTVRVAVAEVFEVTVGVPTLAPVPPLSENSPLAVSEDQSVFVPVSVREGAVPVLPDVGLMDSVAVATAIVVLMESVVSVMVSVPVPLPVVMTTVSAVPDELDLLTKVAPVTPDTENVVLPVHDVPLPVNARETFPL